MLDTIGRAVRRLRAPRRPVAVLRYHRVADLDLDPFRLAVPVRVFERHLEILCRDFTPVALSLFDSGGAVPPGAVALTFDDGYHDFATTVRPLLARHRIPATLFVPTEGLERPMNFWWDRIGRICLTAANLPDRLEIEPPGGPAIRFDLDRWAADRHRLVRMLFEALQPLDPSDQQRVIEELERWTGVDATMPADRRLSWTELSLLSRDPLIEIGGHSVTHPPFGGQDPDRQWREIAECKAELDRRLARPTSSFAYPYGATGGTAALVRKAGFARAFTTREGFATGRHDPFKLPRIRAVEDPERLFERLRVRIGR